MSATPTTAAEAPAESDLSGRRLGDYQMLRRLGRGGMAEVYLAEQISLRRQVAFKVLKASLAGDAAYIRRFHHEAQAAAKLVHANIVQIYEVGCIDGIHFIAQEYVPGQNLRQLLTRLSKGVDARQAANIIRQVAAALHKAAEQNIVHRDIKPENIMLSAVGRGEGRRLRPGPHRSRRRSPEPDADRHHDGHAALHEPRAGRRQAGRSAQRHLFARRHLLPHARRPAARSTARRPWPSPCSTSSNEPKRLEALRPDLPDGLCRIVHKMLAKKPEERYQRPVDLLRDLKGLQIAGLDEDWVSDLPGFTSADLALGSAGRLAATQQLDRLLQDHLKSRPRKRSWPVVLATILGCILAAFAAGGAIARLNHRNLAEPADHQLRVKQFESVKEQYSFAQMATHDREATWKAVAEYFPPAASAENLRHSRLAMKGLARYYLDNERYSEALPLYKELAAAEPSEREFRLIGLIGQAVVYDHQGNKQEVLECLAQVQPYLDNLPPTLGEYLGEKLKTLIQTYAQQGE